MKAKMLAGNNVESEAELQDMIQSGTRLKVAKGFGWTKTIQNKRYGKKKREALAKQQFESNKQDLLLKHMGPVPMTEENLAIALSLEMQERGQQYPKDEMKGLSTSDFYLGQAKSMLNQAGDDLSKPSDFALMLVNNEIENIKEYGLIAAITPPVVRLKSVANFFKSIGKKTITKGAPGAMRAAKWESQWSKMPLDKAISKHAGPNHTSWVNNRRKLIYENPATGRQVVQDLDGGYFRIFQPNSFGSRRGRYLDMMGNVVPKSTQELSHFLIRY